MTQCWQFKAEQRPPLSWCALRLLTIRSKEADIPADTSQLEDNPPAALPGPSSPAPHGGEAQLPCRISRLRTNQADLYVGLTASHQVCVFDNKGLTVASWSNFGRNVPLDLVVTADDCILVAACCDSPPGLLRSPTHSYILYKFHPDLELADMCPFDLRCDGTTQTAHCFLAANEDGAVVITVASSPAVTECGGRQWVMRKYQYLPGSLKELLLPIKFDGMLTDCVVAARTAHVLLACDETIVVLSAALEQIPFLPPTVAGQPARGLAVRDGDGAEDSLVAVLFDDRVALVSFPTGTVLKWLLKIPPAATAVVFAASGDELGVYSDVEGDGGAIRMLPIGDTADG
eukprot:TRINITY_DN6394_c0_g1_i1.p1 TRINITY_DN6394_c0_g1~~TRINITY_DN6394_c0_g1_i1.p1  ORF type:complete len:345 (-),score=61.31 TRINITY_DN6394_c0_g1_i1:87-1121(-)